MTAPLRLLLLLLRLLSISVSSAAVDSDRSRIVHRCQTIFCFHLWRPESGVDFALITNGQMEARDTEGEEPECSLPITPFTVSNFCRRSPCESGLNCVHFTQIRVIETYPGQSVSFQCVLMSSLFRSNCVTNWNRLFTLTWVDENVNPVEGGSEYRLTQTSPCDVSLTVSLQSPKNVTFHCLAKARDRRWTSQKIQVRLSPPRGKGRGTVIQQPEPGDGAVRPSAVGPAVGALGGVVIVAAAAFVLNRRRAGHTQTPNESATTANCALASEAAGCDSEEVVYADVILPDSSHRASASVYEPTVYASVRCS
ncbi:uncharacterized protein LOC129457393 [Periophthalmus magnuspinnatus]|uniref:uncharacterized protein LOC129457393 n=1 Tax=Periophthalmus magnuspinnatus TaxID=409849 RepID=UPI0024369685|nr:uncharacterized protein LOC129457393 [Periophthalmus magnuspinnatus]